MSDGELLVAARTFLQKQNEHCKSFRAAIENGESFSATQSFKDAWADMDSLSEKYADHSVAIAYRNWKEKLNMSASYCLNPDGTDEPVSKAASDAVVCSWENSWNDFVSSFSLRLERVT